MFSIRPFLPVDVPKIYEICLRTGDSGKDASGTIDPELYGHVYAAPYVFADPALCLIAVKEQEPVGYILGSADSTAFQRWTEANWWPQLRQRYRLRPQGDQSPAAGVIAEIHRGYLPPSFVAEYPAHLHIDLLPAGQGQGLGRQLIDQFETLLKARQVRGLHFGVSAKNVEALGFYRHIGFEELYGSERGFLFGRRL